jgi:hypothetical protein
MVTLVGVTDKTGVAADTMKLNAVEVCPLGLLT